MQRFPTDICLLHMILSEICNQTLICVSHFPGGFHGVTALGHFSITFDTHVHQSLPYAHCRGLSSPSVSCCFMNPLCFWDI